VANEMPPQHGWAAIIGAVGTELGLLTLVVLVLGAAFAVASRIPGVSSEFLIVAFLSLVGVVIVIAGVLLLYRARTARLETLAANKTLALHLGEEIFLAFDGAIANGPLEEQQEAYVTFHDVLTSSQLFEKEDERVFVTVLVDAVFHRAKQRSRIK
jgi:hypothetical protein